MDKIDFKRSIDSEVSQQLLLVRNLKKLKSRNLLKYNYVCKTFYRLTFIDNISLVAPGSKNPYNRIITKCLLTLTLI